MISIIYTDDGEKRTLTVQGHGPDIFCAGASALAITLEANLRNEDIPYEIDADDGYARFESSAAESKAIYNHCVQGYLQLEEMYPTQYRVTTL